MSGRNENATCEGCGEHLKFGDKIKVVRKGFYHEVCYGLKPETLKLMRIGDVSLLPCNRQFQARHAAKAWGISSGAAGILLKRMRGNGVELVKMSEGTAKRKWYRVVKS